MSSIIIIPLLRQNFFSNVKYNNISSSFCNKCSPYAPPFFILFPHYFTDHSAVNLIIIKYLFINGGTLFPAIAKLGQKFKYFIDVYCNLVANLLGKNNLKFSIYWDKTNKSNFLQFTQIGIKLIKVISSNSHRLGQNKKKNCSPNAPTFILFF
jgi:hypothetical protein